MNDLRAAPDAFVGVAPTSWSVENASAIVDTHLAHWHEHIHIDLAPSPEQDHIASGAIILDHGRRIPLVVEAPLDELMHLIPSSKEPYTATDALLIKQHQACWRFIVDDTRDEPLASAHDFAKVASTLVEAGSAGIFMPGIVSLHSPRFIKLVTMDLSHPQAMTNLCVHCWHQDGWMITRGLTAFGLPELETQIDQGPNAAYFRLMDLAAGMINQGAPYPDNSLVNAGHQSFRLEAGPQGPADDQVPVSGFFGHITVIAT